MMLMASGRHSGLTLSGLSFVPGLFLASHSKITSIAQTSITELTAVQTSHLNLRPGWLRKPLDNYYPERGWTATSAWAVGSFPTHSGIHLCYHVVDSRAAARPTTGGLRPVCPRTCGGVKTSGSSDVVFPFLLAINSFRPARAQDNLHPWKKPCRVQALFVVLAAGAIPNWLVAFPNFVPKMSSTLAICLGPIWDNAKGISGPKGIFPHTNAKSICMEAVWAGLAAGLGVALTQKRCSNSESC